jgi:hypothetical protein
MLSEVPTVAKAALRLSQITADLQVRLEFGSVSFSGGVTEWSATAKTFVIETSPGIQKTS